MLGGQFYLGHSQPALDHLRRLSAPAGQPPDQLRPAGGGQENQQRVRHHGAHLPRTGKIDNQQRGQPGGEFPGQRGARRAIPVAGESGPFEKFTTRQHPVEVRIADKAVVPPVDFTGSRGPGGGRYREPDFRAFLPQPGYHGTKTTLLEREPAVGTTTGRTEGVRAETRQSGGRVYAEIRYQDDSGPQLFLMTQDEISIGRGGDNAQVNLALYTNDEVSREHLRLRRDPAQGRFLILDNSMNGTWLNGKRLTRGSEAALPTRAQISVAEVITLQFEAKL